MCEYELATNRQNFTEIYVARVKILQKVLGGYFFWLTLYITYFAYQFAEPVQTTPETPDQAWTHGVEGPNGLTG